MLMTGCLELCTEPVWLGCPGWKVLPRSFWITLRSEV